MQTPLAQRVYYMACVCLVSFSAIAHQQFSMNSSLWEFTSYSNYFTFSVENLLRFHADAYAFKQLTRESQF